MKQFLPPWVAMAMIIFLTSNFPVGAAELPGRLRAGDTELMLNGSGTRHKNFLAMYVGGLYLKEKSDDSAAIIGADDTMAIRLEITSMFVSQAKMVASLNQGFLNSTDGNLTPIKKEVDQFRRCFGDKIKKGDVFEIVYLPPQGVIVTKNGRLKGLVPGLAFKQALFGIWLSDKPADEDLKQGMLARK